MSNVSSFILLSVLIGTGATAFMDLWAFARQRLSSIAPLNYALVGRWLGYMAHRRFQHHPIAASPPLRGERLIGWAAHYLIGIAFASLVLAIWGIEWARHPTIAPALIVGIGSVAAPFFLMQPGMGAGIAASRTPKPAAARLRSLVTHTVFGIGLYAAAWAVKLTPELASAAAPL
jgi:hypothetical protein